MVQNSYSHQLLEVKCNWKCGKIAQYQSVIHWHLILTVLFAFFCEYEWKRIPPPRVNVQKLLSGMQGFRVWLFVRMLDAGSGINSKTQNIIWILITSSLWGWHVIQVKILGMLRNISSSLSGSRVIGVKILGILCDIVLTQYKWLVFWINGRISGPGADLQNGKWEKYSHN